MQLEISGLHSSGLRNGALEVLVIDNSRVISRAIRECCSELGFATLVTTSVWDALRLLERSSFQALISSEHLSGVFPGSALLSAIACSGQYTQLPIGLMTSDERAWQHAQSLPLKLTRLHKPSLRSQLGIMLRDISPEATVVA